LLQQEPVVADPWWVAILALSGTRHEVRRREVLFVDVVGLQVPIQLILT
jgi:hypothetical protein